MAVRAKEHSVWEFGISREGERKERVCYFIFSLKTILILIYFDYYNFNFSLFSYFENDYFDPK